MWFLNSLRIGRLLRCGRVLCARPLHSSWSFPRKSWLMINYRAALYAGPLSDITRNRTGQTKAQGAVASRRISGCHRSRIPVRTRRRCTEPVGTISRRCGVCARVETSPFAMRATATALVRGGRKSTSKDVPRHAGLRSVRTRFPTNRASCGCWLRTYANRAPRCVCSEGSAVVLCRWIFLPGRKGTGPHVRGRCPSGQPQQRPEALCPEARASRLRSRRWRKPSVPALPRNELFGLPCNFVIYFFAAMRSAVRVQRICWKTTKATFYVVL